MKLSGFRLSRLILTGPRVENAELAFGEKLTVVTGPSNTGKSFIFQCIDFMLGGATIPEPISQSAGYDNIYLEIAGKTARKYTLRRALRGGEFALYGGGFGDDIESRLLDTLTAAHSKNSASSFLLELWGFTSQVKLKKNIYNETRALSIRAFSHLFAVAETFMMARQSPVIPEVGLDATFYKSAFFYLITGMDDSALVAKEKPAILKARVVGKEELYAELLDQARDELQALKLSLNKAGEKKTDLSQHISELARQIEVATERFNNTASARASARDKYEEISARVSTLNELLRRFALIKKNYISDLARLDFLSEGENLVSQLQITKCPTCGQSIEEESHLHPANANFDSSVQNACITEALKIRKLLSDIGSTFKDVEEEKQSLEVQLLATQEILASLDHELSKVMQPQLKASRDELLRLTQLEQLGTLVRVTEDRVHSLTIGLAGLKKRTREPAPQEMPTNESEKKPDTAVVKKVGLRKLCDKIGLELSNWKYVSSPIVEFDEESMDFSVNGETRQSNGKGVRGLMHAAFSIALSKYCLDGSRPYPPFLILDSPLTTFHEGKGASQSLDDADGEIVTPEVQDSFFEALAETKDIQIIILENKEPPESILKHSTLIRFTKRLDTGRYGFLPVAR